MKRSHILVLVFGILSFIGLLAATSGPDYSVSNAFSARTFPKAGRTDTSVVINTVGFPFVDVSTTTAGTDSVAIWSHVQYKVGSIWLTAKRDTFQFGDALNPTLKAKAFSVQATYAAPTILGSTQIRIINTVRPFPTGDSVSATSYTQKVHLRK